MSISIENKTVGIVIGNKNEDLLKRLVRQESAAQKMYYEKNVGKFLSISRSYINDIFHAEDCVIKAFCKIFKSIETYRSEGNFDGWARRIVVNECLNFLKTRKNIFYIDDTQYEFIAEAEESYEVEEIIDVQALLDELPEAYRMVFNLHVLEEYSHQEIAEMLQISVNASKTQLFRAKQKLKTIYYNQKEKQNEVL